MRFIEGRRILKMGLQLVECCYQCSKRTTLPFYRDNNESSVKKCQSTVTTSKYFRIILASDLRLKFSGKGGCFGV